MRKLITVSLVTLASMSLASADTPEKRSGISVRIGGGVEDFVFHTMRHTSNTNGMWGVYTAVDVQRYVALEAGYVGSASKVNAPIGNDAATLVGSTFEAIGRLQPLPKGSLQPYAFFGGAWRHYSVTGADFTTSDSGMADSDDVFQMPVGAGLAYRRGALIGDARLTYRATVNESLVLEDDGVPASMDSWGVSGSFGYEF